jgi:Zn finger protein HypA/HybF involved in hydrogenase expression
MNKYQEALKGLIEELPYTSGVIEERIKNLQELVDKETPKKVKIKEFDNGEYGAYCPSCNSGLPFHWKMKYCPSCGQKLDWSEE